jgi:hypothetical protein
MRRLIIGALLLAATATIACSRTPVAPSALNSRNEAFELSERLETDNFVFHYSPGDHVEVERAEAFHRWAMAFFGLQMPRKVDYYKMRDREQMWRVLGTPYTGYAIVDWFEVWTYVPFLNHELIHIYSGEFGGWPTTAFSEGLAQAYMVDPYRNDYVPRETSGEPLMDVARRFQTEGRLFPMIDIVDAAGWNSHNPVVTYVQAGAFVRYLIDQYGMARFRQLWGTIAYNETRTNVATKFQTVYGVSLATAEAAWLAWLASGQ